MPLSRFLIRQLHVARRCYSVRAPALNTIPTTKDKSLADLKGWAPDGPSPEIKVYGHVRSVKKLAQHMFVNITDGSSMRPLQAVVPRSLDLEIRPGSAVCLEGKWLVKAATSTDANIRGASAPPATEPPPSTQPSGELQVSHVEVLGPSDAQTYPIQNKYQTPESLRNIPHLRPRMPLNSTMLRLRSDATAILTDYFHQRGFQQCHPPIITSSDCEGAGEAFSIRSGGSQEFFKDTKYLTVSSQLHLEAFSQALGNVWTLSPAFRAEQSDTSRHLSEFYMLEAEMSFTDNMEDIMDTVQDMLRSLARGLESRPAYQELVLNRQNSRDPIERLAFEDLVAAEHLQRRWRGLTTSASWPRVTYATAVEVLRSSKEVFEHEPVWGAGLQSEHERYLAETIGYDEERDEYRPVFITQYPRSIKAFYMRQSLQAADGPTVDCFDLIVPHMGELAGGSMREHRLAELEDNMRLHGLPVPTSRRDKQGSMNWYLDLRRWGSPPHGGFGLGFDRLLSYLTGVPNVRDVVPFPRYHGRCDC
ncbi:tRNA synthetases class II (D, K and n) domain-containing protein [Sarocladium implicatum]|nr:tRNA synthetases class II (D, K and n) domain-containing protein [Sarocladium implicatum]